MRGIVPAAVAGMLCGLIPVFAATNVTTWRYDIGRTGQNTSETQLRPSNVKSARFGKLFSYRVDGYVYAQPLYMSALSISGGVHNVLYVATEHDSVYAFDADQNQLLWKASMIATSHGAAAGATTVPYTDVGSTTIVPEIGITGTPVIDPSTSTLYVVAASKENGANVLRLHALDLATGNEKTYSPVVIQGSVSGTGSGSSSGIVAFQPLYELNRPGLLLLNGHVYVAFGSHGDRGPYHGWVFAYNASTLQRTGIYNTTPNGSAAAIWESGAGLAADTVVTSGRMFIATGNGSSTPPATPYTNSESYGDAVERLDLSSGLLQVSDQWTPFDQQTLNSGDADQGSGGVLVLPNQQGSNLHELIQVGKNGRIELLDRDNLGGYHSSYNNVVQQISGQVKGLWSTPAYWNGYVYFWAKIDTLKQFRISNGLLTATPMASSSVSSAFPGASPVISSNGSTNGIVWAIRSDAYTSGGPAILYAFDATNVGTLLYSSDQRGTRDQAGKAVKFTVPVVVNGKVYVGAQGEIDVYGKLH